VLGSLDTQEEMFRQGQLPAIELAKIYLRMGKEITWEIMEKLQGEDISMLPYEAFPEGIFDVDKHLSWDRVKVTGHPMVYPGTSPLPCSRNNRMSFRKIYEHLRNLLDNEGFEVWYSENKRNPWVRKIQTVGYRDWAHVRDYLPWHLKNASHHVVNGVFRVLREETWISIQGSDRGDGYRIRNLILGKWMGYKRKKRKKRKNARG